MLPFFAIDMTIRRLATRVGAISSNFESMKTNSTMSGLVTSLQVMMHACCFQLLLVSNVVVGFLEFTILQIVLPK